MLIPTLLTTSAFAFTTSAFLIPAEVANAALKATNVVEPKIVNGVDSRNLLELPCADCPFALASDRNAKHEWINGVPNKLMLSLTTEGNQLILNNIPIYPITGEFKGVPSAKQLKLASNADEVAALDETAPIGYDGELTLSYSFEFVQEQLLEDTEVKVLETKLQVLAIDSEMVEVPVVTIQMHKQVDGELTISSVSLGPSTISDGGRQCTTLFCRIVADMMSKVQAAKAKAVHAGQAIKACICKLRLPAGFAKHPTPPGTDVAEHPHGPQHLGSHHHHMGPGAHPHHRHHHGLHRFLHGVKRVFKHFVLPALVGMAAGMAACALGMLVGQTAMCVYMKFRGKGAYSKVEQAPEYEKEGLMTESGLPKYEDVEAVILVDDEKNEVV